MRLQSLEQDGVEFIDLSVDVISFSPPSSVGSAEYRVYLPGSLKVIVPCLGRDSHWRQAKSRKRLIFGAVKTSGDPGSAIGL